MLVVVVLVFISTRYCFMSRLINGLWISSDDMPDKMSILIDGGLLSKDITVIVGTDNNSTTHTGKIKLVPNVGLCLDKISAGLVVDLDCMQGANKIVVGLDGSMVIDGPDTTYFEGIRL